MLIKSTSMKIPWNVLSCIVLLLFCNNLEKCRGQDSVEDTKSPPPPQQQTCNGIVISYTFGVRENIYPHLKNASAQPWSFESQIAIANQGEVDLKGWQESIKFQYNELLVSAKGATVVGSDGFPLLVGKNATIFEGYPMTDLKTAIETVGDKLKGTMFGLKNGDPMPKTIKIANLGYKCPAAKRRGSSMSVCCTGDPKYKKKIIKTKFFPREAVDLSIVYDIRSAYENKYEAQVTIDNINPLGRLDHWNLTWEWMRSELYTA